MSPPHVETPLTPGDLATLAAAAWGVDVVNDQLADALLELGQNHPNLLKIGPPVGHYGIGQTYPRLGARASDEGREVLAMHSLLPAHTSTPWRFAEREVLTMLNPAQTIMHDETNALCPCAVCLALEDEEELEELACLEEPLDGDTGLHTRGCVDCWCVRLDAADLGNDTDDDTDDDTDTDAQRGGVS